jgi:hypothetical protein
MMLSRLNRSTAGPAAVLTVLGLCFTACNRQEAPAESATTAAPKSDTRVVADEVVRSPGEATAPFARRIIPEGTELAFAPVEVSAGPPGSSLVILFRVSDSLSNYTGWVLSPSIADSARYSKLALPPMDEAPGLFDITVKAVFGGEVSGTPGSVIIVLYEAYRTGSGEEPGRGAYVYRWTERSFTVDDKASAALAGVQREDEARSRLGTGK